MTTFFSKSYGGYMYETAAGDNLAAVSDGLNFREQISKAPGLPGTASADSIIDSKTINLSGIFWPTSLSDSDAQHEWDLFRAAHAPGTAKRLYIDDDRYLNAEVINLNDSAWNGLPSHQYTLNMFCNDPYWHSDSVHTQALTPSSTTTFTVTGETKTVGTLTIVVASMSTNPSFTIANSTNSSSLTFFPTAVGAYTIDCKKQKVFDTSGADLTGRLESNAIELLPLNLGSNSIAVSSSNCVLSSASLAWQERYY